MKTNLYRVVLLNLNTHTLMWA
ncbi:Protein of unknown function [Pyronema omphalodes CBS 100304]|uniref:Uncharacterized protein n=1 Tax=Pyronema omphalodes (strain CBS 100304) TaxID=1076935 RepID=U4L4A4_PYROM|nr:Protein of unknown function [Pyronema omphalodes CBS 100304]